MKSSVRRLIRAFGYDLRKYRPYDYSFHRLQFSLQRREVTLILDVGENIGQFARAISKVGYRGRIISFEIDIHGYYAEFLAGLHKWSNNIEVIVIEMSLAALYEGETKFLDLYRAIEDRRYHCISIEPGFTDPRTYEVLQV